MSQNTEFRTCPTTGLKVDLAAEKLIKANAVAAVIFLAIGGLFGLLVALTRWPEVHLLPAKADRIVIIAEERNRPLRSDIDRRGRVQPVRPADKAALTGLHFEAVKDVDRHGLDHLEVPANRAETRGRIGRTNLIAQRGCGDAVDQQLT